MQSLREASVARGAPAPRTKSVLLSASEYRRLLDIVDQAPIDSLPIPPDARRRAEILGYSLIRHVRLVPEKKLAEDLGADVAHALHTALAAVGLAPARANTALVDQA